MSIEKKIKHFRALVIQEVLHTAYLMVEWLALAFALDGTITLPDVIKLFLEEI